MNSEYGFESATFIGLKKNQNGRVETPWTGYSYNHSTPIRWSVYIRAGRVLTVTVEAQKEGQWELVGELEETARAVKIHPGEVSAEQIDRIVERLLARIGRIIDRGGWSSENAPSRSSQPRRR